MKRFGKKGNGAPALARLLGGLSGMGLIFLVIIIIIFFVTKSMFQRNDRQAAKTIQLAQYEPKSALEKFFLERGKPNAFREDWRALFNFMSKDDLAWFDKNYKRLASLNPRTEGMVAAVITDDEKKWSALQVLTQFGT